MSKLLAVFYFILFGLSPIKSHGEGDESLAGNWAEEPVSFIGIQLDKPLMLSATDECPKVDKKYDFSLEAVDWNQIKQFPEGKLCWFQDKTFKVLKKFKVYGVKISPLSTFAEVTTEGNTLNGNVQKIKIGFLSSNFSSVKAIFTTKYNQPHYAKVGKLKTKGGAEFETQLLGWKGNTVFIHINSMEERHYDSVLKMLLESGSIHVTTKSYLEKIDDEFKRSSEESASKL